MQSNSAFRLELITQDDVVLGRDVHYAVVPSGVGPIGVLPGHAPLLGILDIGILKARDTADEELRAFVGRGFFMISRDKVTIIARQAELAADIDLGRAQAAGERARKLIAGQDPATDIERAREAMLRAAARIKAAG